MIPTPGSVNEGLYLRHHEQAEANVIARKLLVRGASSIHHRDGRTLVAEALSDYDVSGAFIRDLTVDLQHGDYAEAGRRLYSHVVAYLRSCPGFEDEVRQEAMGLMRGDNDEDDDDFVRRQIGGAL